MARAAPVQDRIRYIVDSVIEAGFTTFDEAIEAYYTETFDDASPLDRDQRLSRNRRLPRLLGALRDASKDWSHWERRGFQEQITQGAEDILVEELELFRKEYTDTAFLREMTTSELGGGQTAGTGRGSNNRRTFQDSVRAFPNPPPSQFPSIFLLEPFFLSESHRTKGNLGTA